MQKNKKEDTKIVGYTFFFIKLFLVKDLSKNELKLILKVKKIKILFIAKI